MALIISGTRKGMIEMARCWCGKVHPRGCALNGEVKHFVLNWKLYWLRKDGRKG